MFTNPYLSTQLARERQREMLAHADQQRLARRLHAESRAIRQAERPERRIRRALRKAARLRTELRA